MNEARPYASLSSGLLARKGSAKPAMRPQGFSSLEDLGWNDMGYAAGEASAAPAPEHVPSSIAALTPAPRIARTAGSEPEHDEPEVDAVEAEDSFEPVEEPIEAVEDEAPEAVEAAESIEAEAEPPFAVEAAQPDFEPEEEFHAEPVAEEPEPIEAPVVVSQQRAILERFDAAEAETHHAPSPAPRAARAEIVPLPKRAAAIGGRKAAFTLRLDGDRHLRLRLACAVTGRSAQQIVAHALDEALAGIPEIEALASQVPAKPGRAGAKRN